MMTRAQLSIGSALLCCAVAATGPRPVRAAAASVRALTGAHTRIVWVQGDGTYPYAAGFSLVLMGLDSDDGKGERVILGERGSYLKPMLIGGGKRIVFSTHEKDFAKVKTFVVNFDGTGRRFLG